MLIITILFCQKLNFFPLPSSSKAKGWHQQKKYTHDFFKKEKGYVCVCVFSLLLPTQPLFLLSQEGKSPALSPAPAFAPGNRLPGRSAQPRLLISRFPISRGEQRRPIPPPTAPLHIGGSLHGTPFKQDLGGGFPKQWLAVHSPPLPWGTTSPLPRFQAEARRQACLHAAKNAAGD